MDIIAYIAFFFGFTGLVNITVDLIKAGFRVPNLDDLGRGSPMERNLIVVISFVVVLFLLSMPSLIDFLPARAFVEFSEREVLKSETVSDIIKVKTCEARFNWKRTTALVIHRDHVLTLMSPSCRQISEADMVIVNRHLDLLKKNLNINE